MSTRNRIIEAAMGLFIRHGYRLTSMELVGQEAGLTRQALYHHFKTKEALFRAVLEAVMEGAEMQASTAGLELERDGKGLAEVLFAQIVARWQHLSDLAKGSPYGDELLQEHQRQSQDLHRVFAEKEIQSYLRTIDRFCARGLEIKPGTASVDLARYVQVAERGAKAGKAEGNALDDLKSTIELLVTGALVRPGDG